MPDHLLLPHQNRVPDDFSLQRESIIISHYQLYAVEKYILQRTPFRHLLVVYTGDPTHTVTFDAFTANSQAAWATTIATLRADGAKPKATAHGIILVTSLAHFRSDYNIIKIPSGNFLSVRDQLYSNVDLLRMGCFGRTALTLEDPSDVTKERFITTFYLPENTITPVPNPASVEHLPQTSPIRPSTARRNTVTSNNSTTSLVPKSSRDTREKVVIGKTKDPVAFVPTVLELIKLIQAGLTVFGLFPDDSTSVQPGIFLDGLLCDNTVKGIKKWITRIGGPCLGLEASLSGLQSERLVDPKFVAGLISMVLAVRNQLAYLGYSYYLPRDPFFHPYAFSCATNSYLQSIAPPAVAPAGPTALGPSHHHHTFVTHTHSVLTSTPMIPAAPPANSVLSAAAAAAASLTSTFSAANAPAASGALVGAVLTKDAVDALQTLYDNKQRSESRKVRRVIKNKLVAAVESDGDGGGNVLALALTKSLSDGEREPPNIHHQSLSLTTTPPGGQDARQGVLSGLGSSLAGGMRGGGAALASVAGVGGAGDSNASLGDPGTLYVPTVDLGALILFIVGRSGLKSSTAKKTGVDGVVARTRDRAKRMSRDLGKIGASAGVGGGISAGKDFLDAGSDTASPMGGGAALTYAYEKERDDVVASSVKALWGGRVAVLVRIREDVEAAGSDGPERWSINSGASPAGGSAPSNGFIPGAGTGGGWTGAAGWGGVAATTTGSSPGNIGAGDAKRWLSGLKADKTTEKEPDIANMRKKRGLSPSSMASDGEEGAVTLDAKRGRPYDGRSTEEESDVLSLGAGGIPFGGMQWPGRMRGKFEGWAGKARRKGQSVDLTTTSSPQSGLAVSAKGTPLSMSASNSARSTIKEPSINNGSSVNANDSPQPSFISNSTFYNSYKTQATTAQRQPARLQTTGLGIQRPSLRSATSGYRSASASRAQSPTLPPMLFSGDGERDMEDDDLLSSGQVSPLSDDRPNPFGMVSDDNTSIFRRKHGASGASSTTNLTLGGMMSGATAATESSALDAKLLMLAQQKPGSDRKRPWFGRSLSHSARVSSWADPVSAREDGDDGQSTPMIYSDEDDDESLPPLSFDGRRSHAKGKRGKSNERDLGALSVSEEDIEGEEESDVSRMGGYLAPQRAGNMGGWKRGREKARFHSLLSIVDDGGVLAQEPLEESEDEEFEDLDHGDDMQASFRRKKMLGFDPTRRRSFHDLASFSEIEVLPVDYMKIDVSMCGQLLINYRREEHLRNVIDCVRLLSDSLAETNAGLREHYDSHMPTMPEIDERAGVLADLEAENARAERIFQATNTLSYETEQFRVRDLWQAASPSRRKVFEMREKVFGAGGRRLPAGMHGAHGPYNRLQWTLDGEKRLVDHLGRTESEAEEEEELDRGPRISRPLEQIVLEEEEEEGEEEEENVVKHPTIKPMWLLRFFTSWGARWSAAASSTPAQAAAISDAAVKGEDEKEVNASDTTPNSAPPAFEDYSQAKIEKVPTRSATHPT